MAIVDREPGLTTRSNAEHHASVMGMDAEKLAESGGPLPVVRAHVQPGTPPASSPKQDLSCLVLSGAAGYIAKFGWTREHSWVHYQPVDVLGAIWNTSERFDWWRTGSLYESAVRRLAGYLRIKVDPVQGIVHFESTATEIDVREALEGAATGFDRCAWTGRDGRYSCLYPVDRGEFCGTCRMVEEARGEAMWFEEARADAEAGNRADDLRAWRGR